MFEHLLKLRYAAVVIVVLAALHAIGFLAMGAEIAGEAYWDLLHHTVKSGEASRQGLELLHSLDFLFVALVFIILSLGIAKLFLIPPARADAVDLPSWLKIDSITELKVLLWETILTTLLIAG